MRLAAYTDYTYHESAGEIYANRAFALFLAGLASRVDELTILGRVDPEAGRARYLLQGVRFIPLPYYESLANPVNALRALPQTMQRFWRALDDVDRVFLGGPHPTAIAFALLALLRRKRAVLVVRQNLPEMIDNRHPRRPALRLAARLLEGAFRLLGRVFPVIVVGPELARNYRRSRAVLEIAVSLVTEEDLVPPEIAARRAYDGPLTILSVGRLETEKNPLLMIDTLAALRTEGRDWRLVICGEGEMEGALAERIEHLGVSDRVSFAGYVPLRPDLLALYRESHALLHISWSEGLPQVLIEAAASGLPMVATDVGGIGSALDGAALLIPPGDAAAAASALDRIADDPGVRASLLEHGHRFAADHVLDAELEKVADFIAGA